MTLQPTNSLLNDSSWVIRNRETGEVIMETFQKSIVDKINTAKYEAVPILQHLQELNQSTKAEIEDAEVELEELLESGDLEDVLDAAFKVEDLKNGLK